MTECPHPDVLCINPHELIRKYRCTSCGEVILCGCDEEFAKRFLSHQMTSGTELTTQRTIPITLGFVEKICNTCRGLPEEAHPKAELYGRSSKVRRYYWREIYFETMERFGDWADARGFTSYQQARTEHDEVYDRIEKEVTEGIHRLHQRTPKYVYQEKSQQQILDENNMEVIDVRANYVKREERKTGILDGDEVCSAEEFAARHFRRLGYEVLFTESVPFHVIFGVFTYILIQHPADPRLQTVAFGDRAAFDQQIEGRLIMTLLPEDFGTAGYAARRVSAIRDHLKLFCAGTADDLLWLFEYWVEGSADLRQYLWAHRTEDVKKARKITAILPVNVICRIAEFLLGDYWGRYIGWPDLLVYSQNDFCFVEVKSSGDRLREDQKRWIEDNSTHLHLPFKLFKIHGDPS